MGFQLGSPAGIHQLTWLHSKESTWGCSRASSGQPQVGPCRVCHHSTAPVRPPQVRGLELPWIPGQGWSILN